MGQKIALVVGNNLYESPFRPLEGAIRDAARIAGFLEFTLGFQTKVLDNPTARDVTKELHRIVKTLTPDSKFFFYFAGHGLCVGGSANQSLLCRDADELLLEGVEAAGQISPEALAAISRKGNGDMFFCLDVCRSQTLRQKDGLARQEGSVGLRDAISKPSELSGLPAKIKGRRLILSSCADGQCANDDGVFATALVEEMTNLLKVGRDLELGYELLKRVKPRLKLDQTPELSGTPFVLVPGTRKPLVEPIVDRQEAPNLEKKPVVPPQPPVSPAKTPLQLTTEANDALKAGRYEEAELLANEALRIDSSFGWAQFVLTEAQEGAKKQREEEERRQAEERRREEEKRRREEEKRRRNLELDQTLNEGWLSFNAGDFESALEKANVVLQARPTDEAAGELKTLSEEALRSKLLTLWGESASREAGGRQALKIGSKEYGLCWIPAGEFEMGSSESEKERDDGEKLHHVKLTKAFWLLETPVTQALYKEVMGANPSEFKGDDLPVETVSWNDAMKFCQELTKRFPKGVKAGLPTEAQWEYACRAGTKTAYWYGNATDAKKMNYYDSGIGKTTPVKRYPANPWGLYDMHGNVWEWTSDYFGDYPTGTVADPKGPNSASNRVERGGGWYSGARYCRSANRRGCVAADRGGNLGFRFLLSCD